MTNLYAPCMEYIPTLIINYGLHNIGNPYIGRMTNHYHDWEMENNKPPQPESLKTLEQPNVSKFSQCATAKSEQPWKTEAGGSFRLPSEHTWIVPLFFRRVSDFFLNGWGSHHFLVSDLTGSTGHGISQYVFPSPGELRRILGVVYHFDLRVLVHMETVTQRQGDTAPQKQPKRTEAASGRDGDFISSPFTNTVPSIWAVFFLLYPGYILFFCLRFAYVLPTPLQCPPTPGSCVLICLHAPTLTAKFLILPTRPAFGASVGSAFCLVFSCFAYAGLGRYGHLVPVRVVPNWRDDRPKGLKAAKSWRRLREAYAKPTRRTGYKCCLFVCLSICLFVCWPSFPSFPSISIPSISYLQHRPTQIESQSTSFKCLRKPPHTT